MISIIIIFNLSTTPPQKLRIPGSDSRARAYNGIMDELRFWSVARTQEEIQESMNRKLSGEEENLVIYFPMDDAEQGDFTKNAAVSQNAAFGFSLKAVLGGGFYDEKPQWIPSPMPISGNDNNFIRTIMNN